MGGLRIGNVQRRNGREINLVGEAPNGTAYKRISQTVQMVSIPPAPIYRFLGKSAMWTRWMAGTAHKSWRYRD